MKKGFTLVELLAVIIVLGIIATIGIMSVSNVIDTSKESTYQEQVRVIEKAAQEWAIENTNELPEMVEGNYTSVTVETLSQQGYLRNIPKDPRTGKEMTGYVIIKYTSNQYTYVYQGIVTP